jgi:hypothetical protein
MRVQNSSLNEELIVQYLLGELSEVDADRLDELSVTDDDFAEFLERVENELVDDYVRGELSEHNRARFESYHLALPERREKVAIARALLKRADQTRIPHFKRNIPALSTSSLYQWIAMAAALSTLVLGGYLLLANIQLKKEIAEMKDQLRAVEEREQQSQRKEKRKEKPEQIEKQLADQQVVPGALFAMTLSPQPRDVASVPEFTIPTKTEFLVVTLKLERDDFPLYEAVLKDSTSDKILWQSGSEKSANRSVVVKFPAKILNSGDYILEIFGEKDGANPVIINGYPFYVLFQ